MVKILKEKDGRAAKLFNERNFFEVIILIELDFFIEIKQEGIQNFILISIKGVLEYVFF